jgi:hypothetical protein
MLPSAVNDTMRDMMAQIRDVGDGIRGGTYTMTAPVITGGSITGVALSGNTFTNPVITGGSINNTPIGASTANTGAFTTLGATGVATFSAGTVSAPAITTTGDTNTGIFFPAADTIAFTEGGVEAMRITSSSFVGIGTTSPGAKLQVVGTAIINGGVTINTGGSVPLTVYGTAGSFMSIPWGRNASEARLFTSNSPDQYFAGTSAGDSGIQSLGTAKLYFGTEGAAAALFMTNNAERMRITSDGDLLVGTTSTSIISGWSVKGIAMSGDLTGGAMTINSSSSTGTQYFIGFGRGGSLCGSIQSTGTNATSYSTSSDYRLKENIAPMTGALAKIAQLKPVTYTWKSDGTKSQGFIAHELQAVVPDCVIGEKDAVDADGNIKPQGVDTSFLVATLTAAIQELKAEFDAYKAAHP